MVSWRRRHATFGVGLGVPTLRRVVGTELVLTFVCVAAVKLSAPTATTLSLVAVGALLPFVVVAGRSAVDWAITLLRFVRGYVPSTGVTGDENGPDGSPVGVHRRGDHASCVLELQPPQGAATTLGRSAARTAPSLDLAVVSECLHQHDISVARIDIVSHGERTASGSPATEVYERLIGPLPAVATRTVWVTVTIDVPANRRAIDARGGTRVGVARTASIATERVARALESHGIASKMLTANDIRSTAMHLCRGVPFESLTESWRSAPLPGVLDTGFGFDMRSVDDAMLADLWATPTVTTTSVVRLSPAAARNDVSVVGSCRFVTRNVAPTTKLPGPVSMHGRHRVALLSSLPLAITSDDDSDRPRSVRIGSLSHLHIPTAGCGQLLGSDVSGNGVAARVFGPGVAAVHVAGELYLAQQLVFRAIATGARVEVHTDRPHAWGPLVDSIATPERLRIDGGPHRPAPRVDLMVHDFSHGTVDIPVPRSVGSTVMTVTEHRPLTPAPDPDVSIVQPGASGDRIHVRTPRAELDLLLVTIPQETAFIGRPRTVRRTANV